MTSRERVLAAIRHQEPDKVPIDLGATTSSGISAIAYHHLKQHLGITEGSTYVFDVVQQLAQPEDELLEYFAADVINVGRVFNQSDEDWCDAVLPDGVPVRIPAWFKPELRPDGVWDVYHADGTRIATMPRGATFFDQTCFPYEEGYPADYDDLGEDLSKVHWVALPTTPWHKADQPDFWQDLRAKCLALRQSDDRALVLTVGTKLVEPAMFLRRMDNLLADLLLDVEEVERLLDAFMDRHLITLDRVCRSVGDLVDIYRFGDDLGMNTGPLFSPDLYRNLFKSRHRIICDYVHAHSQMVTFMHSCGSIFQFLPDLIEIGVDIINPVQISAKDMEPERLKKAFGRDITFWGGGIDTQSVLNLASPQEVKYHVKRNLEIFAPGGGYVFNAIHNIMPEVSPQNIVAMFDAVKEFNGA
ncbi:MAG: methyltransferase [Chloroflexi bacterium]|nr:methyltransferase [Chloroflexota bacterium]